MLDATLMIVEDDPILALLLKHNLESLEYQIVGPFTSGEAALLHICSHQVDLVLMDVELAGNLTGIEAAERIYRQYGIPVIFLTSHSQDEMFQQAKVAAPYGYLIKPVHDRELASTVEMALHRAGLDRELAKSRKALAESESRFRHLFEHAPLGIYQSTLDGRLVMANETMAGILGYKNSEEILSLLGDIGEQLYEDSARRAEFVNELKREGQVAGFEFAAVRKDGEVIWLSQAARLVTSEHTDCSDDRSIIEGFMFDITEQKNIEKLQEFLAQTSTSHKDQTFFHALTRFLAESLQMDFACIARLDGDGPAAHTLAVWRDGRFEENVSYPLDETPCGETIGKEIKFFPANAARLFPKDTLLQEMQGESYFGATLWGQSEEPIGVVVLIGRRPRSDWRFAGRFLSMTAPRAAGELERFLTNEALQKSEERFMLAMEAAQDGLYDWQLDTDEIYYSPAWKEILGYREDELDNAFSTWERLTDPRDVPRCRKMLEEHLSGKRDRFDMEFRMLHKDGRWVDIHSRARVYNDASGRPVRVVGTHVDISERKKAEDERRSLEMQLQHAQKLEAVGTLAGGIAHDFNNILGVILGYAEMAKDECLPNSSIYEDLEQVILASERARDLVKKILDFSRKQEVEYKPVHPVNVFREVVRLLQSTFPSTITIEEKSAFGDGMILVDPLQMHQILLNLCTNALHAMECTGGRLRISLDEARFGQEQEEGAAVHSPGRYARFSVRDNGPGIPAESISRIFDPYFTTKGVGKGTGMGLAVVHGLVRSYGGRVTVDSTPGVGTVFHVFIPLVEQHEKAEKPERQPTITGNDRILLIDDESLLAGVNRIRLERLGYSVKMFLDSREALAWFRQHPDDVDLVVTDQTMPNMTGLDIAKEMLQIKPGLPIILCTGFSSHITPEVLAEIGIKGFLMKPVSKRELALQIRALLDTCYNDTESSPKAGCQLVP